MLYQTKYNSPIGKLTLASDSEKLIGLWIEGQKYFASTVKCEMIEENKLPIFQKTKNWLDRYFKGEKPVIPELLLSPSGSEFRQKVWKILCEIPYGEVTTYGDVAKKLGASKMSAQAVGGAVGHNPISIIIPCHRVVGHNGNLTGYAGGLDLKRKLLQYEGVRISNL